MVRVFPVSGVFSHDIGDSMSQRSSVDTALAGSAARLGAMTIELSPPTIRPNRMP